MPGSILFILQNACLHFVVHGKLVAYEYPASYGASVRGILFPALVAAPLVFCLFLHAITAVPILFFILSLSVAHLIAKNKVRSLFWF